MAYAGQRGLAPRWRDGAGGWIGARIRRRVSLRRALSQVSARSVRMTWASLPGVFTLIEDDPPAGALPKAGTVCQENGKPFPAS
jgi:hypothetical protein